MSKKLIRLISKTTTLHVHHVLLYTSLPFLHDYDVKIPNFVFMFSGGRETSNDHIFVLFLNLDKALRNSTLGGFTDTSLTFSKFEKVSELHWNNHDED